MDDATLPKRSDAAAQWTLGPIVDADAHIDPPFHMWKDYLPASQRDKAPYIEEGDEFDNIVFEGAKRPLKQLNNTVGKDVKDFKVNIKFSEMREVWKPEVRLADMDADGIDAAIMFGGGPLGTTDSELYIASYDAYSRWVMDYASADKRRLVPVAYLPMRDVDETVRMVKDVAKMGFTSVNLPAFPQNPDGWSTTAGVAAIKTGQGSALTGDPKGKLQYYQPEFDKLWAALVDNGMTLTHHLGARVPRFGDTQHFLADMPMSKLSMAEPVAIAIFNGIFDRFPDLKMVTVESGVGWFSFFSEYCDRTWERQRFWTNSKIKHTPSYYMDKNVYGSFIQDRGGILNRDRPGSKNIMWSSDYPHSETTFPQSREIILRDFAGVPENDIKDIICNRCRDLYRVG